MVNLFINYYIDKVEARRQEIDDVLERNIENELIDNIVVLCEYKFIEVFKLKFILDKIKIIEIADRPTFRDFFNEVNKFATIGFENDINIISNSDIYFDDLRAIKYFYENNNNKNTCMALSRWDIGRDGKAIHFNRHDSFDTWIFYGSLGYISDCDFNFGKSGCDNSVTERIQRAGYNVINPSVDIKTMHLHLSGIRNYNPREPTPKPYLLIPPHKITDKNISYIKMNP